MKRLLLVALALSAMSSVSLAQWRPKVIDKMPSASPSFSPIQRQALVRRLAAINETRKYSVSVVIAPVKSEDAAWKAAAATARRTIGIKTAGAVVLIAPDASTAVVVSNSQGKIAPDARLTWLARRASAGMVAPGKSGGPPAIAAVDAVTGTVAPAVQVQANRPAAAPPAAVPGTTTPSATPPQPGTPPAPTVAPAPFQPHTPYAHLIARLEPHRDLAIVSVVGLVLFGLLVLILRGSRTRSRTIVHRRPVRVPRPRADEALIVEPLPQPVRPAPPTRSASHSVFIDMNAAWPEDGGPDRLIDPFEPAPDAPPWSELLHELDAPADDVKKGTDEALPQPFPRSPSHGPNQRLPEPIFQPAAAVVITADSHMMYADDQPPAAEAVSEPVHEQLGEAAPEQRSEIDLGGTAPAVGVAPLAGASWRAQLPETLGTRLADELAVADPAPPYRSREAAIPLTVIKGGACESGSSPSSASVSGTDSAGVEASSTSSSIESGPDSAA